MISVNYYGSYSYEKELLIDDIGNCAIEAIDLYNQFYYFVTKTELGMVSTFQYGPVIPDMDELPPSINCSYTRKDYNKQRIIMDITKFLGKKQPVLPKKPNYILEAYEISPEEVYMRCPNMVDIIKNWTYNKDGKKETKEDNNEQNTDKSV